MKIKLSDGTVKELSSRTKEKQQKTPVKQQTYQEKFLSRVSATEQAIQQRGTGKDMLKEIGRNLGIGSATSTGLQKGMGVLQALAVPPTVIESTVANVGLKSQKSKPIKLTGDPRKVLQDLMNGAKDLATEAYKGVTLQKKGEFGDIFRNAGLDPTVSAGTGLFLNVAGTMKLMSMAGRAFGNIAKMSDKGILRSGKHLIQASKQARDSVGAQVGEAFKPVANEVVDGSRFLDDITKLPKTILDRLEEQVGNLDDLASNMNIEKVRVVKRFLGKLRAGRYGKETKGAVETLDDMAVDKAYSSMKSLMESTIKKSKGDKVAGRLMKLEKAYSDVERATDVIQSKVVDPKLLKPTRGGAVAEALKKEGDLTTRMSLNILKKSSWDANRSINKAVRLLEIYNRNRLAGQLLQSALKAAAFGGAIGAAGGRAFQKATD